ncbi:MAG TPA: FCD domain-containing protein [Chloroflexota bacterium]|nr:FCD domain-containing protein [Chloroflexota bacterium]
MLLTELDSDFLQYLVTRQLALGDRLPPLNEISDELGISVGKLREQLEVARSLGFVSVRPRVGIQREPFNFAPAVLKSVLFGLGSGEASFAQFAGLRRAVEDAYWHEAVGQLTAEDKMQLQEIVARAHEKLYGDPVHVPNGEHRQLHLLMFSRVNNPFVTGLLAAYWDAYEASELTRYARYEYWLEVWQYHARIVAALAAGDFEQGRQLLREHYNLLPMV